MVGVVLVVEVALVVMVVAVDSRLARILESMMEVSWLMAASRSSLTIRASKTPSSSPNAIS